eukprot:TRINITY_DN21752_c0_g1_i1.p1 TRINITY_DN21752_c0_g1~~TRINITY_DN21752_c0_g1_i1.p1  ORF type:complete len:230 (-),score=64.05 TRINITY_DN21752_c0_g1_i1:12-701(-)
MGDIAIVLAGCGRYDGSDVAEATATAVAVEKHGFSPVFFSFDKHQRQVFNHLTAAPKESEDRNMLAESWRLAKGRPQDIQSLDVDSVAGIIIPGGVGILRNITNLTEYMTSQEDDMTINEDLQTILDSLKSSNKPVGLISHSALLAAIAFKGQGVKITFGDESSDDYELCTKLSLQLESQVEEIGCGGVCVDEENKILSTPGFMSTSANFIKVHESIDKLVEEMSALVG